MKNKLICVCLLLCIVLVPVLFAPQSPPPEKLSFCLRVAGKTMRIEPYEADDGMRYVFLPAHCDSEDVWIETPQDVVLNKASFSNGDYLTDVALNVPYCMETADQTFPVQFMQAQGVATMYLNTRSGSMEQIHADKSHKEAVTVTVYDENGQLRPLGADALLKGRGNSTWQAQKKPYTLRLSKPESILAMDAVEDWVLLANAFDQSNLYNALAFDMAQYVGMEWTPQYRYVELFLNDSYHGLYLLTQKVQCAEGALQLDLSKGDFLCQVEPPYRWQALDEPFLTQAGRTIEPKQYRIPTDEMICAVQRMEDMIFSAPRQPLPETFDIDSWACRYLIDEILANNDADFASSYFYRKDGTYFAGPVWDYDMVLGNQIQNANPTSFLAKNLNRSVLYQTPYDTMLLENEAFDLRMKQLYRTVFMPYINGLLQDGIADKAAKIRMATTMNALRWQDMFEANPTSRSDEQSILCYLQKRIDFLNSVWIDGTDYCTLQFEIIPGRSCWNASIVSGQCPQRSKLKLSETLMSYGALDPSDPDVVWIDAETGNVFDFDQPVRKDHVLVAQTDNKR